MRTDWTAKMIELKLQPKLKDSAIQRLKPFILIAVALWLAFFQLRCGGGGGGDAATTPTGDTLIQRSGFHGSLWFRDEYNERTTTIRADAGQAPVVSGIFFIDGTPSQGCLIRNNIAATITATGDTIQGHNYLLKSTDTLFMTCLIFSPSCSML